MRKCYFFLRNFEPEDFDFSVEKFKLIHNPDDIEIMMEKYYKKLGQKKANRVSNTTFPEMLMFFKYYMENIGNIDETELIFKTNFYIYNEDIYIEEDNEYKLIEADELYFATTRDMWFNPFFLFLHVLEKKKKVHILRRNTNNQWFYDENIYYLSKAYDQRETYIGDFLIPLLMQTEVDNIINLLKSVKDRLGQKVCLYTNDIDNISPIHLYELDKTTKTKAKAIVKNYLFDHVYNFKNIAFVSFDNCKCLYRVLFTYNKSSNNLNICGIKKEELNKDNSFIKDISGEKSLELNSFLNKLVKILGVDSGMLYILEKSDNKFVFYGFSHYVAFSIKEGKLNQVAEDFYNKTFDNILK